MRTCRFPLKHFHELLNYLSHVIGMSRVRIVNFHQIHLLPLFPNSRGHVRHSIDSAGTSKYDDKCRAGSRVPLRDIRVLRFLSSRTSPHCETEPVFLPVVDSPLSTGNITPIVNLETLKGSVCHRPSIPCVIRDTVDDTIDITFVRSPPDTTVVGWHWTRT